MELVLIAVAVLAAVLAFVAGRAVEQARLRRARGTADEEAARILAAAEKDAESRRKAEILAGKEAAFRAKEEWEREEARRREEIERTERRVEEREESLDRKFHLLDEKTQQQEKRAESLAAREAAAGAKEDEYTERLQQVQRRLESLAGLSADEAKRQLMQEMEEAARAEAAQRIREVKEEARRDAEREAKKIISLAIQRIAADHTAETTVSVVSLPSDEMKGRIIGREGRNIRAFEQATGIDVIIDDTPEAVVLSGFDPIRRETARIALEKLVTDGRIHPGRIEDVVTKSRKEVETGMREAAEEILYELGIHGLHPEIIKVLGRLKFRTSYGQNQLAAQQGSRDPGRQHGGRDGLRRDHGEADGPASRCRKGHDARARGHARRARLEPVQEVQRVRPGAQRHQGAPRRGAAPLS